MFDIQSPCDQRWEAMTPRGEGRHCARCDRVVVDLSRLTRAQAEARMKRATGRVCLAVRRDVVTDRPVFRPEPAVAPRWAGGLVLAAALGGGCASGEAAAAEVEVHAELEPLPEPGPPMEPVTRDAQVERADEAPTLVTRAVPQDELALEPDPATPTAVQRRLTADKHRPTVYPATAHPVHPGGTYLTLGF